MINVIDKCALCFMATTPPSIVNQTKRLTTSSSDAAKEIPGKNLVIMLIELILTIKINNIAQTVSSKQLNNMINFFIVFRFDPNGLVS